VKRRNLVLGELLPLPFSGAHFDTLFFPTACTASTMRG
jgi:hypothetical protein